MTFGRYNAMHLSCARAGKLLEMDSLGPRYSGSGDIGYGFVDLQRPGFEQSNNGLSKEGAGTRVCGYAIKNSELTVV